LDLARPEPLKRAGPIELPTVAEASRYRTRVKRLVRMA
jgi:hypothetical protein